MGFSTAIFTCLKKYFTISGRAPRAEFWWWTLFLIVGGFAAGLIDVAAFTDLSALSVEAALTSNAGMVGGFFSLATMIPTFTVTVRRLHDTGRTGGWAVLPYLLMGVMVYGALLAAGDALADIGIEGIRSDPMVGGTIALGAGVVLGIVSILLLIWMILPGTRGENYFGPDPLGTWSPLNGYDTATPRVGPSAIPRA